MDLAEVKESLFAASDAKLHGEMCRLLSGVVCKVLGIFPVLEASRPRSKSGIQALCSLHIALEKAKGLLQHCSESSKLYLVRLLAEDEMFRVIRTGKHKTMQRKMMITKVTFVGPGFTRKTPKYERFIRPSGLRFNKAHVTHPELKCNFNLEFTGQCQ